MQLTKRLFKTPKRTALVAAVACGFFIHLFGLLTIIHNYDDVYVQPFGFGTTIQSGRWGLAVLGGIFHLLFGSYNVPLLYGVIFLVFIGLSAAQLIALFNVKSHKIAALIGVLFAVFPTATSTLLFKYTAHYYGVAIFLAVMAAKKLAESKRGFFLGTLFIVLSLSIYQAYLPLTLGLLILILLKRTLEDDGATFLRTLRTGLFFCLSVITALAIYRVMVDVSLLVGNKALVLIRQAMPSLVLEDFTLTDYQGINGMGQFTLPSLLASIVEAVTLFFTHPFNGFGDLASTPLLMVLYPVCWALTLTMIVAVFVCKKKKLTHIGGAVLLLVLFPLAVNFIMVMCPDSRVYTLMLYGFVLVPCAPLLLYECWRDISVSPRFRTAFKRVLATVSVLIISAYAMLANLNYTFVYYQTCQTENYVASLVAQIRMTEDYTDDKPWAFIGTINDPLLKTAWDTVPVYGGSCKASNMLNAYSQKDWITHYVGYTPKWANNSQLTKIKSSTEFQSMPVWPDAGSIRVINGCVVVRFQ